MFTPPVILDTNVFVGSGFNQNSASRKIIDAIELKDLVLVWNEATRGETLAVLDKIPPLSREDVEVLFREEGRYEGPTWPERFEQVDDVTDRKFHVYAHPRATHPGGFRPWLAPGRHPLIIGDLGSYHLRTRCPHRVRSKIGLEGPPGRTCNNYCRGGVASTLSMR
jgi:hypothetical protein